MSVSKIGSTPWASSQPARRSSSAPFAAVEDFSDAERVGLYGFGAAAHIVAQVAKYSGRRVFAFTRPGDRTGQTFARSLGCVWAGDSDGEPPEPLDAAIIFAPAGELVPQALRAIERGGTVVCAGIHMSDIPSFPYELLWGERTLRSIANLTRRRASLATSTKRYPPGVEPGTDRVLCGAV